MGTRTVTCICPLQCGVSFVMF